MNLISPQERRESHNGHAEPSSARSAQEIRYEHDVANYIAAMLAELRQMAGKAGFGKLVTSIDAAYYEAYGLLGERSKAGNGEAPEKTSGTMEPEAG